jgi:uncharacterized membrane protein
MTPKPANPIAMPETTVKPLEADERHLMARIRKYFLTGLVVAGPVIITFYLIWSFVTWMDDLVRPFIPVPYRPETYLDFYVPGYGIIIAFVLLTFLGFLTANLVGRKLLDFGDGILNRVPFVRPIYKTAKQIFETLFSKSGSSFRKVALVEFPAPGMWSLVFLSQSPSAEVADKLPEQDNVSAFMPCTPNPTTGFFFYLPRKKLIELDVSVEAAMTLIMSAGMVQPGDQQKKLATLAAQAQAAQIAQAAQTAQGARNAAAAKTPATAE